jgi:hypothetical protein
MGGGKGGAGACHRTDSLSLVLMLLHVFFSNKPADIAQPQCWAPTPL